MNLYILTDGTQTKIGITADMNKRMQTYHTHNPRFHLYAKRQCDEDTAKNVEMAVRTFFRNRRSSVSREWFDVPAAHVAAITDSLFYKSVDVCSDRLKHFIPLTERASNLFDFEHGSNRWTYDEYRTFFGEMGESLGIGTRREDIPDNCIHISKFLPDIDHAPRETVWWSEAPLFSDPVRQVIKDNIFDFDGFDSVKRKYTFYALVPLSTGYSVAIPTAMSVNIWKAALRLSESERKEWLRVRGLESFRHDNWNHYCGDECAVFIIRRKTPIEITVSQFNNSLRKWVIENSKSLSHLADEKVIEDICFDSAFPLNVTSADALVDRYFAPLNYVGYCEDRESVRKIYTPLFNAWNAFRAATFSISQPPY